MCFGRNTQVAIRESWGVRQGNAAFDTLWGGSGGEWAATKCTRCRAWEMKTTTACEDTACEPAMWLDASVCLDESQAAADTARRAVEQNTVRSCLLAAIALPPPFPA